MPDPGTWTQPDLEAHVWSQFAADRAGITLWTYATTTDWPGWQLRYGIELHTRARSKSAARDRAEAARQLMNKLPAVPWTDGVITYVTTTDGPFWLPDDDGCPRYVARYEVRCHPSRLAVGA
jgi:hypothetical protein